VIAPGKLAAAFWQHGRADDCPIIDAHGHMGRYGGIYLPRCQPDDMLRTMDAAGVRLLLFSHHVALADPAAGNPLSVAAAAAHPDRFRAYLAISPHQPDTAAGDLAAYDTLQPRPAGFKLHPTGHNTALDAPAYERALAFADERGLLVLSHTWEGDLCGPAQVRRVAERYPNVRWLLGHSIHGAAEDAAAIAREFPNVYLDLCAVPDERGPLEVFLAAGLAGRMLFGTDLPWFDPHYYIGGLLSADMSDADRHAILHGNAERLLAETNVLEA